MLAGSSRVDTFERRQIRQGMQTGYSALETTVDVVTDSLPVVGGLKDAKIAGTGVNPVTGEKSSQLAAAGFLFIGFLGLGGAKKPLKWFVKKLGLCGDATKRCPTGKHLRASSRPHSILVDEFHNNPGDWERVWSNAAPGAGRKTRGGVSLESMWRNKQTGEMLSTHEAFDRVGNEIHKGTRKSPNLPDGGSV